MAVSMRKKRRLLSSLVKFISRFIILVVSSVHDFKVRVHVALPFNEDDADNIVD